MLSMLPRTQQHCIHTHYALTLTAKIAHATADLGSSEYIEKKDYGSLYAFHRCVLA